MCAHNICEIDLKTGGRVVQTGDRNVGRLTRNFMMMVPRGCAGALWASGAGFLFICGSRATSNAAPYLRSLRFAPEKSRLEEEKCEFEKGAKYILNICAVTMHQILNGGVRWFGNSRPMARRAHVCPGRERESLLPKWASRAAH